MRCPLFLPPELSYCKELETPESLIPTLLQHSEQDLLTFFECGCEDETWTADFGGPIMKSLINWFNDAYFSRKIGKDMAEQAAVSIQNHFKALKPHLSKDIAFRVEDTEHPVSSMMFGGVSSFFHDLIYREGIQKKQKVIPLKGINKRLFEQIEEACYTGKLEYLWREEPEEILKLMRQAAAWDLKRVEAYVADVYKRYINASNIIDMLQMAYKEDLVELQKQCCTFINQHQYGVELEVPGIDELSVVISQITDRSLEIVGQVKTLITHVAIRGEATKDSRAYSILNEASKLKGFDLQESEEVPESLLEFFPNVQSLNLSYCHWLSDDTMLQALPKCPALQELSVAGNSQLTFRTWAALVENPALVDLNVSRCRSLNDEDLDLLAASCPNMVVLNVSSCDQITDQGLLNLAGQAPDLQEVNFAWCSKLNQDGIIAFAQRANKITRLDLRHTKCVTRQSIIQMVKMLPNLRKLHVSRSDIDYEAVQAVKEINKELNLAY